MLLEYLQSNNEKANIDYSRVSTGIHIWQCTVEENLILLLHSMLRKPRCNPFTITMYYNVVAKVENSLKNSDKFHRVQWGTVEPPLTATSPQLPLLYDSHFSWIYTLTLILNLCTTATFFCPQGGCCGDVQLYNAKVLPVRVYLNGNAIGFHAQI